MNIQEQYILNKLKEGDENAFRVIYKQFFPRLYYFVLEYVTRKDLAENIVQDTMLTLWNKRDVLTDDTHLSGYLFTVAKNNCLYRLRELKYSKNLYMDEDVFNMERSLNIDALVALDTSDLTLNEIEKIIEETLNELPPQCRNVFYMSRFEDKKYREIAEVLNISVKAVEAHISKALRIFRQNLKEFLPLVAFLFIDEIF